MHSEYDILLSASKNRRGVDMQREKERAVSHGTVEGIVLVNGRPQIERSDMPLAFSFDSIEALEQFCEAAKSRGQGQH